LAKKIQRDYVSCMICGKRCGFINHLHLRVHDLTVSEYVQKFPNASLASSSGLAARSKALKGKKRTAETKKRLSESIKKSWKKNPKQGRSGSPLSKQSRKLLSKKMMGHLVSDDTRQKIGESGLGREPWNKGLTKETDDRLKSVSKKISIWNSEFMTEEKKEKISQTLKRNYAQGMKVSNSKNGYRTDLKMSFRSTWEANFARILILLNRHIIYEQDRFPIMDSGGKIDFVYVSDFKLENGHYIEIKGHAESRNCWTCECKRCIRDKKKMQKVKSQYPGVSVSLFGKREYATLKARFRERIDKWE